MAVIAPLVVAALGVLISTIGVVHTIRRDKRKDLNDESLTRE